MSSVSSAESKETGLAKKPVASRASGTSFLIAVRKVMNEKIAVYLAWLGLGIILAGSALIVSSVFARRFLGAPLPGDVELPEILLPLAAACFYTLTNVQHRHVRATFLVERFSTFWKKLIETATYYFMAILYSFVAWQGLVHGLFSLQKGFHTDVVHLPEAPIEFAFVFAIAIFSLQCLVEGIYWSATFKERTVAYEGGE